MTWLPSPTWFTMIGLACLAGAAAAVFLLKAVSLGFDLGLAAMVLFLLAACAHTYTARGEEIVQTKFDAFKTAQAKLAADIASQQAAALAKANSDAAAAVAKEKERGDALTLEVAGLKHSAVVLSGALSNVLQHSGSRANGSDPGPKPGGKDAATALPDAAGPQAYDEQQLGQFFAATRAAYDSALNAWQACVGQYEAIRAPTLKGSTQ